MKLRESFQSYVFSLRLFLNILYSAREQSDPANQITMCGTDFQFSWKLHASVCSYFLLWDFHSLPRGDKAVPVLHRAFFSKQTRRARIFKRPNYLSHSCKNVANAWRVTAKGRHGNPCARASLVILASLSFVASTIFKTSRLKFTRSLKASFIFQ